MAILLPSALYVLVPSIGQIFNWNPTSYQPEADQRNILFLESLLIRGREVVIGLWILCLGASIGSFLNVVVYRLPLGRSLSSRGSNCPHCRVPIKVSNNIPIFSWLALRGRCRACRLPISPRYPIVETIVASVFLFVFIAVVSAEKHHPDFALVSNFGNGVGLLINEARWDVCLLYLNQVILFSVLISVALIEYDRKPIPMRLFVTGCVIALLAAAAAPSYLTTVAARSIFPEFVHRTLFVELAWPQLSEFGYLVASILTGSLGALVGALSGWVWGTLWERRYAANGRGLVLQRVEGLSDSGNESAAVMGRPPTQQQATTSPTIALTLTLLLVGATLGWQGLFSTLMSALVVRAVVLSLFSHQTSLGRLAWSAWITVGLVVHLICSNLLMISPVWPGAPFIGFLAFAQPVVLGLFFLMNWQWVGEVHWPEDFEPAKEDDAEKDISLSQTAPNGLEIDVTEKDQPGESFVAEGRPVKSSAKEEHEPER